MPQLTDPRTSSEPGPLEGVRVLEFTQIVAGPVAGLNLGDLGADVIKVEPPEGEQSRRTGSVVPNESKSYQALNRGKRSLAVNLQDPRGLELIHRLVKDVDVVLLNYRLGVPERLGIDYDTLSQIRPGLIYWQNTGFGEQGPEAYRAASDMVAQAYSGLMVHDGKTDDDGAPEPLSSPISDIASGLAAAMAICAALYHREQTGEGQYISTSLLRTGLMIQQALVMREPISDAVVRDQLVARVEAARTEGRPYDELLDVRKAGFVAGAAFRHYYSGYRAKDGALVLGALTKPNRDGMRRVLGVEDEPSDHPDYDAHDPANQAEAVKWREVIRDRFLTKTVAEWVKLFDDEGVPVAPVHLPEQMSDDPQVQADGMLWDIEHTITGPQRVVGPTVLMSRTPARVQRAAPALGEHTAEVLDSVGVSADEVAGLAADGVVTLL